MSSAKRCDRCGRFYEGRPAEDMVRFTTRGREFRGYGIRVLAVDEEASRQYCVEARRDQKVDLCPDCLEGFYRWLVDGQPEPHSVPEVCLKEFG